MTFDAGVLLQRLRELQGEVAPSRYVVAYSGGLDSMVLLHALHAMREQHRTPILAVHVDHGLHPDAASWQRRCRATAERLGVEYANVEVAVTDTAGSGIEAAAREVRYAALRDLMQQADVLLSAHHLEDQAETLLLNLMRGSGLAGLAGIGAAQPFGPGLLVRPMLDISRAAIEKYARRYQLEWVDDPSNLDLRFDRNYLRREILPRLRQRWPAVSARLGRSAALASEAAALQDDLARLDLAGLAEGHDAAEDVAPDRLDIAGLLRIGAARQRNVLRYAVKARGLPQIPASRLRQVQEELLPARTDAQPLVRWHGGEIRRYRQKLYLLPASLPTARDACPSMLHGAEDTVVLGPGLGTLSLERVSAGSAAPGIDPDLVAGGLELRFRHGGEKIRPYGRVSTRPVKKLLQEEGIVPWMRQNLPLLYSGETLVAVADLWIAADCAHSEGFAVRWSGKPSLI